MRVVDDLLDELVAVRAPVRVDDDARAVVGGVLDELDERLVVGALDGVGRRRGRVRRVGRVVEDLDGARGHRGKDLAAVGEARGGGGDPRRHPAHDVRHHARDPLDRIDQHRGAVVVHHTVLLLDEEDHGERDRAHEHAVHRRLRLPEGRGGAQR